MRTAYYMVMAAMEDEDSQIKGITVVLYFLESGTTSVQQWMRAA